MKPPLLPVDVIPSCPCCRAEGSLADFEHTRQIDGNSTCILICRSCLALLDLDSYINIHASDPAAAQAGDYYEVGAQSADEHIATDAGEGVEIAG